MDRSNIIALFEADVIGGGIDVDKMSRRRANFAVSHFCNHVEYVLRDYLDEKYGEEKIDDTPCSISRY